MTDYLTVVEVLAIHEDQIVRYGGSFGIRDRGILEAALFRPQTGYYADLLEETAALVGKSFAESSVHRRQQTYGFRRIFCVSYDQRCQTDGWPRETQAYMQPL